MYDELVKRLRCQLYGNCPACVNWYTEEVEPNLWRERCAAIDAADAIEQLSKPRWIPVTERLPEIRKVVLITDGIDVGTGWMNQGWWNTSFADIQRDAVTHWMPLPEPPKEV